MLLLERLMTLRVGDLLSRGVVEVSSNETMSSAATKLLARQISGAPVIDEQGRCVGMLSAVDFVRRERDLRAEPGESGGPHTLTHDDDESGYHIDELESRVHNYMSSGVQTVSPNDTLLDAARIMCASHIHRLVVLDEGSRPVGMLTALDVVAALINSVEEQTS